MLGKTHMALGLIGAVAATPVLLHLHWETVPQVLSHTTFSQGRLRLPNVITRECEFVAAAAIGSITPDFDEQHSLMARDAEKVVLIAMVVLVVALIVLLRLETSIAAWILGALVCIGLRVRANIARRVALAVIGAGSLYLGLCHYIPGISGLLFGLWCLGAMFSKHRTWTHSALGWATFTYAITTAMSHYGLGVVGIGSAVGYALHILADIPSGGVGLVWPVPIIFKSGRAARSPRMGMALVKTGGMVDHLIGAIAILAFITLAIV